MPYVSIIVVNYNGRRLLPICLAAIDRLRHPAGERETIVVDNGSTDGSLAYLRGRPDVRVLVSPVNSFCAANNLGAAAARGEYLAFLNNDAVPHPGWLDALVMTLDRSPRAGAAGSKMLLPSGQINSTGHEALDNFYFRDRGFGESDRGQYDREGPALGLSAGALLVRRAAFESVGGFDPDYVMYLDDVDLSLRFRRAGWRLRYVPASVVTHACGATARRYGVTTYFCNRNRLLYIARHFPDRLADHLGDSQLVLGGRAQYLAQVVPEVLFLAGRRWGGAARRRRFARVGEALARIFPPRAAREILARGTRALREGGVPGPWSASVESVASGRLWRTVARGERFRPRIAPLPGPRRSRWYDGVRLGSGWAPYDAAVRPEGLWTEARARLDLPVASEGWACLEIVAGAPLHRRAPRLVVAAGGIPPVSRRLRGQPSPQRVWLRVRPPSLAVALRVEPPRSGPVHRGGPGRGAWIRRITLTSVASPGLTSVSSPDPEGMRVQLERGWGCREMRGCVRFVGEAWCAVRPREGTRSSAVVLARCSAGRARLALEACGRRRGFLLDRSARWLAFPLDPAQGRVEMAWEARRPGGKPATVEVTFLDVLPDASLAAARQAWRIQTAGNDLRRMRAQLV